MLNAYDAQSTNAGTGERRSVVALVQSSTTDIGRVGREWLRYLRSQNRSLATLDSHAWCLCKFVKSPAIAGKTLAELTREDLQLYFDSLWATLQPASVLSHFKVTRAFLNWTVREHILDTSPQKGIPEPRVRPGIIKPFSPEELSALFDAAGRTTRPMRNRAILAVWLSTGIRLSELCRLRHEDVEEAPDGSLRLRIQGKGGGTRRVGLTPEVAMLLQTAVARNGHHERVFGTFNARTHYQMVRRLGQLTGISKVHPHRFRNTFGCMFLENGGGIDNLQTLMGHTDIRMTLRYTAFGKEGRAITEQMECAPVIPVNGTRS